MIEGLLVTDPVAMGPYSLLRRLGGGGMGQVYLAKSVGGRLVAVKVIRPELAADPEFRARFTREVAAARKVSGMLTAVLIDADTEGAVPWLATAYIAGPPLSAAVREAGPLPLASLLPLAAGLAEALQAMHAVGVVHRDLKPSNVLLAHDGPRVIDFGVSYAAEASALTQSGTILGTPGYMSPEQAQGRQVGPASDVFSLGAVLAYAATGAGPFGDGPVAALVYRVVNAEPDLDRVPGRIRPLIERCLAKAPGERPGLAGLLSELGGELIPENWLPAAVTSTFSRYAPSARIAAMSLPETAAATAAPESSSHEALGPDAPAPESMSLEALAPEAPAAATPARETPGLETPPGSVVPPAGHRGLARRRQQAAVVVAVVAVVAGVATWLALGMGGTGDPAGDPAATLTVSASPVSAPRIAPSAGVGMAGKHGSPASSAVSGKSAPTPAATTPSVAAQRPTSATSAPAARQSSAVPTSAASSPAKASTTGPLSATGGITYSCSDFPASTGSSDKVSYQWVNHTPGSVNVYYVSSGDHSGYLAGYTGAAPGNATTGSTLVTGDVYLVDNAAGQCLGAVKITGTGTITIS
jgi:hypothetical protein